jgi:hypothetical protein
LAENFEILFSVFHIHVTFIHIFENLLSIEITDAPEKLQLELFDLQYVAVLPSRFNQEALITFYVCSSLSWFS